MVSVSLEINKHSNLPFYFGKIESLNYFCLIFKSIFILIYFLVKDISSISKQDIKLNGVMYQNLFQRLVLIFLLTVSNIKTISKWVVFCIHRMGSKRPSRYGSSWWSKSNWRMLSKCILENWYSMIIIKKRRVIHNWLLNIKSFKHRSDSHP